MHQSMHAVVDRIKGAVSTLKTGEVAEALIATWCVEYLRIRRLGGFNPIEIIAISLLMLGIKAIIMEANRRRYNDKNRTFVMSSERTPVGEMGVRVYTPGSHMRTGRPSRYRQRSDHRDRYSDV